MYQCLGFLVSQQMLTIHSQHCHQNTQTRVNNQSKTKCQKERVFLTKITKIQYTVARQLPDALVRIRTDSFQSPVWLPSNRCISSMGGCCTFSFAIIVQMARVCNFSAFISFATTVALVTITMRNV